MSTAAKNIGETLAQFKGVIDEKDKENFKQSLANIKAASGEFKEMVAQNKGNVNPHRHERGGGERQDRADRGQGRLDGDADERDRQGRGRRAKARSASSSRTTTLYDDAKDVVASLKTVSSDIEQGKGTLGKLVKDDSLYVEAKETMKNVNQFTAGLKDGNLVGEAQVTMKKIQQAAEGVQEQTPITILGHDLRPLFLMRACVLFLLILLCPGSRSRLLAGLLGAWRAEESPRPPRLLREGGRRQPT